MDQTRSPLLLLIVGAVLTLLVVPEWGQSSKPTQASAAALPQRLREPAGASRCQVCHPSEVEEYAQSAMAHSLRQASHEPDGKVEISDARISAHSDATGYWQRLESGGETTDYRIDYVIGSGNHASGYLLAVAGHLFQSPIAYYKSRQAYDLAPGYEGLSHPDFTRPISEACLFCHSGTALKIPGTSNQYRSPPFAAESISCDRCHGSAEKHLADPRPGTIINPAKLPPAARDSICEQCHLLGVGRVLNPQKKFSDFRPGEPLENVFTTYVNVSPPGVDAEKFKVISHVEQLARSVCARASKGKLWCGTCHDPHHQPVQPVQFFRAKCLSCHTQNLPSSHPGRASNCIACHMPRRDAKDGGHTAFTDHRIQRRPEQEQALPADAEIAAWRDPAPDLQTRNLGIAYINVGMERRSREFIARGYRMLTEVQQQFSNDSEIFTSMGSALLLAKQTREAELAFERALQLSPSSATGETNAASAYLQAGDIDQAVTHLERAVAIDPLHLAADAPLIELYKQQGKVAKAAELSSQVSAALETATAGSETENQPGGGGSSPAAATAFKNLKVLEGVPPAELIPTMRFISASLGVECGYCHVPGHFDKDDKKPKQIARAMMRMMAAIDTESFDGDRKISCYSCHRGSVKPEATPIIDAPTPSPPSGEAEKPDSVLPTADQLVDRYVQALGGAFAIENVTSRQAQGTSTRGNEVARVEIFDQDPNQQMVIRHSTAGDSVTLSNAHQGWSSSPGQPRHAMSQDEMDGAEMDADLHFALHIKQLCADLRVESAEKIGERKAFVVSCANPGRPPVALHFDEQSGLLVRLVRYVRTPLGLIPTRIDFGDYRDVDGVKVAFSWTVAEPDGRTTTELKQVLENVPIDQAKFATPDLAKTLNGEERKSEDKR
jgi:photosynthetic reaction center cytochrome c subunit